MLILTIRTDKPESELGLFEDKQELGYEKWEAHRQLSETVHSKIEALLKQNDKDWHDVSGVVVFKGPGSFTGLRIGMTVANSLSANLEVPVISTNSEDWIKKGIRKLLDGQSEKIAMPDYGREARITLPRK